MIQKIRQQWRRIIPEWYNKIVALKWKEKEENEALAKNRARPALNGIGSWKHAFPAEGNSLGAFYYRPKPISNYNLKVMNRTDQLASYVLSSIEGKRHLYWDISSTYGYRLKPRQPMEDGYRLRFDKAMMNLMGEIYLKKD